MSKQNRIIIYRLYPNKKQTEQFQKTFGCVRFVYNQMLSIQEQRYKNGESHLSKFEANSYCNHNFKTTYTWLNEVDKFAITNAIYHLEDGYQRMFKRLGKHPKYKNKHMPHASLPVFLSVGKTYHVIKVLPQGDDIRGMKGV